MANNLDINKAIGDVAALNAEIQKTVIATGQLVKNQTELNKLIGKSKGVTDLNAKQTKAKQTQNEVEKQGNKLLGQRNTLIAKQAATLQPLTKEVIKQKEAIKEQNRQLREQAKADLGIKKRSGLFREVTKSILASLTVMGLATGALKLIWSEISRTQGFQDKWTQGMNASRVAMDTLTGSIKEAVSGNGGFQDFNKRLDDAIAKSIELTKRTQDLTKAQIAQLSNLNGLLRAEELYRAVSDDATLSFQKRAAANEKAYKISIKRLDQELKFAAEELENDAALLQNKLDNNQVLTNDELTRNQQLKTAYDNARVSREMADRSYGKFKRELELDDFEQQLDFIFDVGDKRKTANEKLIADESLTAKERLKILSETNRILNESFDDQINLFESENKLQIDRNKLLTLNNKESFEYARGLGLSERATNRLLEVIRERIAATSDMDEATKGLNESIKKQREEETKLVELTEKKILPYQERKRKNEVEITDEMKNQLAIRYEANLEYLKAVEDAEKISDGIKSKMREDGYASLLETGNLLFDAAQNNRDRELEALRSDYAAKIEAEEGNKEVQDRLAEELKAKDLELRQQQARSERNQALFGLAVTTTQKAFEIKAQAAVLAANPLTVAYAPVALAQLGLLLGTAAVSGALIASQPIPEFFKGTESAPAGLAWIAEKGPELLNTPDGGSMLVNEPSVMNLQKGTQVKTAEQTQDILNKAIYNDIAINGNQGVESRLDSLLHAFRTQPREITEIDEHGMKIWLQKGNSKTQYLNRKGRR